MKFTRYQPKMTKDIISGAAYLKMVLHAIKYPHCAVRGVLLGESSAKLQQSEASEAEDYIRIVDVIPAIHTSLLAPTIEILFIHIDAYCKEEKLKIVGLYFSNQLLSDTGYFFIRFLSIVLLKFFG
jgi:hypothetical protein